MSDPPLHIASAVVKARPAIQEAVAARIAALAGTEVAAVDQGRIIIVIEAGGREQIGATLRDIADLDGVLSATLVFEHSEGDTA